MSPEHPASLLQHTIKVYATVYHILFILTSNEISFYYSFWLWLIFQASFFRRISLPYKQCPCSSITLITWSTYFSQVSRSEASTITRTTGSVPDWRSKIRPSLPRLSVTFLTSAWTFHHPGLLFCLLPLRS